MSEQQKQALFELWIDGALSDEQHRQFMAMCAEDPELEQRVNLSLSIKGQADSYHEVPAPDWDAGAIFEDKQGTSWWNWKGLPAMSFATSLMAIVMVVARVEFSIQNNGFAMSFGGSDGQVIEQLVNERIASFEQQQKQVLLSYNQDLQERQLRNNSELSRYLIESSRTERREDFAELIKYVNQQRSDDQLFFAKQLNKLQDNLLTPSEQWEEPEAVSQ